MLLALPQIYGVGYPVMDKAVASNYVLWFLVLLMLAKMVAASLTIGIGGSGGVFAPSLFTGAMAGTAFGVIARHLFGSGAGSPAIYGVIAMGAVFAAAAQAPLTSIASVIEMTGNYTLTLPVMLAVGLAAGVSKRLTHGTIYTTKLLRRGTDIARPKPASMLQALTVGDVMQPLGDSDSPPRLDRHRAATPSDAAVPSWAPGLVNVEYDEQPQALYGDETLEQALRQLVLFGPDGLPVVSPDRQRIIGWVTQHDVIRAMAQRITDTSDETAQGTLSAEWGDPQAPRQLHTPSFPLEGYRLFGVPITADSTLVGHRVDRVELPPGGIAAAVTTGRRTVVPRDDAVLHDGDRLHVLVPSPAPTDAPAETDQEYSEAGELT